MSSDSYAYYRLFKVNGELVMLNTLEIIYIQAFNNYMKVFTIHQSFLAYATMNKMEESLCDKFFVRVHRSYIVNKVRIVKISNHIIHIGAQNVPIQKEYQPAFIKPAT